MEYHRFRQSIARLGGFSGALAGNPSGFQVAVIIIVRGRRVSGLKFFKQFLSSPAVTGSVTPSSRALADAVVRMARVSEAGTVVEFGPGSGAITGSIVANLAADAAFFAMEINADFVAIMRDRFPNVTVHHDSATNTRQYLEQIGASSCDSIVSGLPWTFFKDELQDELLETIHDVLRPGGVFSTYMYIHSPVAPAGRRFVGKLRSRFSHVEDSPVVWRNLPPAIVHGARK
jgi:phosphatidylethanolamine/phosphatidyl-N-methylethanolamine N-methyltransferase